MMLLPLCSGYETDACSLTSLSTLRVLYVVLLGVEYTNNIQDREYPSGMVSEHWIGDSVIGLQPTSLLFYSYHTSVNHLFIPPGFHSLSTQRVLH